MFFPYSRKNCLLRLFQLLLLLLLICFTGCPTETGSISVTGVSIGQPVLNMTVGDEITVTVTVSPYNADETSVSWQSSNSQVVSVNHQGVIAALSAGTATVTVTTLDGGFSASCTVTVTETEPEPAEDLEIAGDWYWFGSHFTEYVHTDATNTTFTHRSFDGSLLQEGSIEEYDNESNTFLASWENPSSEPSFRKIIWTEISDNIVEFTQYEIMTTLEAARNSTVINGDETLYFYLSSALVPPIIFLEGEEAVSIAEGEVFADPGATVVDWGEPDTTINASSLGGLNPENPTAGTYTLTYSSTDTDGNTAVPVSRIVEVGSGFIIRVE